MTSQLVLALIGLAALIILYRWQSRRDAFDLRWLLVDTETKKVSLPKLGQLCALIVSTWAFVVLVQRNLLTEWFFAGYIVTWTGSNLADKWITTSTGQK
jgi:hypothetical protein